MREQGKFFSFLSGLPFPAFVGFERLLIYEIILFQCFVGLLTDDAFGLVS